ncbi:hypothetical protein ACMFMG_002703 [Clarireedia jacksonii]
MSIKSVKSSPIPHSTQRLTVSNERSIDDKEIYQQLLNRIPQDAGWQTTKLLVIGMNQNLEQAIVTLSANELPITAIANRVDFAWGYNNDRRRGNRKRGNRSRGKRGYRGNRSGGIQKGFDRGSIFIGNDRIGKD